jgi:hypothetical protein
MLGEALMPSHDANRNSALLFSLRFNSAVYSRFNSTAYAPPYAAFLRHIRWQQRPAYSSPSS